jgi:FkbM family methyltransferase
MKILFDVGANEGQDSLGFDGVVYAFEPHPDFANLLRSKNKENYNVVEKAVSNVVGTQKFNFCRSGGASSLLEFKDDQELNQTWPGRWDVQYAGKSIDVEVITLESFIEENKIDKIDFLHVDAQGVDLQVLEGLGKHKDKIVAGRIECAANSDKSIYKNQTTLLDSCKKWLVENGFEITNENFNDPLQNEINLEFVRVT